MMIDRLRAIPKCYSHNWRNRRCEDFVDAMLAPLELVVEALKCVGLIVYPFWLLALEPLWAVCTVKSEDIRRFLEVEQEKKKRVPTSQKDSNDQPRAADER